jgi:hypothetical protein
LGHKARQQRALQFTYLADELGHILETRPVGGLSDSSWDSVLTPMRKPPRPLHIDTAEKQLAWDRYWERTVDWWESERANDRRSRW